jgi:hypothetical protein
MQGDRKKNRCFELREQRWERQNGGRSDPLAEKAILLKSPNFMGICDAQKFSDPQESRTRAILEKNFQNLGLGVDKGIRIECHSFFVAHE